MSSYTLTRIEPSGSVHLMSVDTLDFIGSATEAIRRGRWDAERAGSFGLHRIDVRNKAHEPFSAEFRVGVRRAACGAAAQVIEDLMAVAHDEMDDLLRARAQEALALLDRAAAV